MVKSRNCIGLTFGRGHKRKPLDGVYNHMLRLGYFVNAYGKLYPNKGATTKGVNEESVQGMTIDKF